MSTKKKVGILGASGYTGADAVRLLARHPNVEITAPTANTHAGKAMDEVFPHFFTLDLPRLTEWEKVDWTNLDAVFCGLPHGTTQEIIAAVMAANPAIKILDMSADFRLRDMDVYAQWYGHAHRAPALQGEAVYGLTEFYREKIAAARLVASPRCYPPAAGLSPYSGGTDGHAPESEQEIGCGAGSAVTVNFTPHLIPMSRGELCTSYVRLNGASADDLRAALAEAYRGEPFVHVAKKGVLPQTQNVRGSNYVQIGVFADRIKNRAIVISVLDNLVKGSAGQAIQNMNLMLGFPETTGLEQIALFP